MIQQSHIQNIATSFEPEYAAFVQSDFPREAAQQFGSHHQLTSEKTEVLQDLITLYLLTAISYDELTILIQERCDISEAESGVLVAAIHASIPVIPSSQASAPTETTATSPQTTPGLRTMAKDMEQTKSIPEEIVYTTTQEALLREGNKP